MARGIQILFRTLLLVCAGAGPAALQAAGEVYLRNGTCKPLTLHRTPTPNRRRAHHPAPLLAGLVGRPGAPRTLDPGFHPGEAVRLVLEPGEVAALGWEVAPAPGVLVHLGVQTTPGARRSFLVCRPARPGMPGRLAPYAHSRLVASLEVAVVDGLVIHTYTGSRERQAEVGPDPEPDWIGPAPAAPAAPAAPGITGVRTRTRRLPPRVLATWAGAAPAGCAADGGVRRPQGLVFLANQSTTELFLGFPLPELLDPGPGLRMQIVAQGADVAPGAWVAAPTGRQRIGPGETLVVGVVGAPAGGHRMLLGLAGADPDRVCYLRYVLGADGQVRFGAMGPRDVSLLAGDSLHTDTLILNDECFAAGAEAPEGKGLPKA